MLTLQIASDDVFYQLPRVSFSKTLNTYIKIINCKKGFLSTKSSPITIIINVQNIFLRNLNFEKKNCSNQGNFIIHKCVLHQQKKSNNQHI